MNYMGSKSRIAKYIVPIIQKCIDDNGLECYIEPFVGGANVIDKIVCENRIGTDVNEYLISLFNYVLKDGKLLDRVPRELYNDARTAYNENQDKFDKWVIANIGFLASYNGRWFDGGYAKPVYEKTKNGTRYRDYYQEKKKNLEEQIPNLKGITFDCCDYRQLPTTKNYMIYCDPPYENTKQFKNSTHFDFGEFWQLMREWSVDNFVIISELSAPDDFVCIWQKDVQRSMKSTDSTMRAVEKLFTHKDGLYARKYIIETA